jgi:hypothetical protein
MGKPFVTGLEDRVEEEEEEEEEVVEVEKGML